MNIGKASQIASEVVSMAKDLSWTSVTGIPFNDVRVFIANYGTKGGTLNALSKKLNCPKHKLNRVLNLWKEIDPNVPIINRHNAQSFRADTGLSPNPFSPNNLIPDHQPEGWYQPPMESIKKQVTEEPFNLEKPVAFKSDIAAKNDELRSQIDKLENLLLTVRNLIDGVLNK